ncbi:myb-like protein X [Centruroides sculpturatus]|uniref:myb-like protein X n=1 Tax=Centruroides sculpturatus TaxID=218467 RepID=UPI000C6D39F9|nr:myb-like protein X [Centruroides sculpturatus]
MLQTEDSPSSEMSQIVTDNQPKGDQAACTSSDCPSNRSESSEDSRGRLLALENELQARTRDLERLKFKIDKMKTQQISGVSTPRRDTKPINIRIELERLKKDKKVMAELLKQSQQEIARKESINKKLKQENDKLSRTLSSLRTKLTENGRNKHLLEQLEKVRNELSLLTSKSERMEHYSEGQDIQEQSRIIEDLIVEKEQLKQCLSAIYLKITPYAVSLPSRDTPSPVWTEDVRNTFEQFCQEKIKLERELEHLRLRVKSRNDSQEDNKNNYETTISECSTESKVDCDIPMNISEDLDRDLSPINDHRDMEVCKWKEMYQLVCDKYRSTERSLLENEKQLDCIYSSLENTARHFFGENTNFTKLTSDSAIKVINRLSEECTHLKESLKKVRKEEENQFYLQNCIIDAEKILQKDGRTTSTLKTVIGDLNIASNMESKFASLAETMLQIYTNQLEWVKQLEHNNAQSTSEGEDAHSSSPQCKDTSSDKQSDEEVDSKRVNEGNLLKANENENEKIENSKHIEVNEELIHKSDVSDIHQMPENNTCVEDEVVEQQHTELESNPINPTEERTSETVISDIPEKESEETVDKEGETVTNNNNVNVNEEKQDDSESEFKAEDQELQVKSEENLEAQSQNEDESKILDENEKDSDQEAQSDDENSQKLPNENIEVQETPIEKEYSEEIASENLEEKEKHTDNECSQEEQKEQCQNENSQEDPSENANSQEEPSENEGAQEEQESSENANDQAVPSKNSDGQEEPSENANNEEIPSENANEQEAPVEDESSKDVSVEDMEQGISKSVVEENVQAENANDLETPCNAVVQESQTEDVNDQTIPSENIDAENIKTEKVDDQETSAENEENQKMLSENESKDDKETIEIADDVKDDDDDEHTKEMLTENANQDDEKQNESVESESKQENEENIQSESQLDVQESTDKSEEHGVEVTEADDTQEGEGKTDNVEEIIEKKESNEVEGSNTQEEQSTETKQDEEIGEGDSEKEAADKDEDSKQNSASDLQNEPAENVPETDCIINDEKNCNSHQDSLTEVSEHCEKELEADNIKDSKHEDAEQNDINERNEEQEEQSLQDSTGDFDKEISKNESDVSVEKQVEAIQDDEDKEVSEDSKKEEEETTESLEKEQLDSEEEKTKQDVEERSEEKSVEIHKDEVKSTEEEPKQELTNEDSEEKCQENGSLENKDAAIEALHAEVATAVEDDDEKTNQIEETVDQDVDKSKPNEMSYEIKGEESEDQDKNDTEGDALSEMKSEVATTNLEEEAAENSISAQNVEDKSVVVDSNDEKINPEESESEIVENDQSVDESISEKIAAEQESENFGNNSEADNIPKILKSDVDCAVETDQNSQNENLTTDDPKFLFSNDVKIVINSASSEVSESTDDQLSISALPPSNLDNHDLEDVDDIDVDATPVIEPIITKEKVETKENLFYSPPIEAEGSKNGNASPTSDKEAELSQERFAKRIEELETEMLEMKEVRQHHMQVACELAEQLEAMKKRESELREQLASAEKNSSLEVEGMYKEWSGREQSYQDEIAAWKENVQQQNSVLQRLKADLDQAQQMVQQKEQEIAQLRGERDLLESETQTSDQEDASNSKELKATVERLRKSSEHYQQQLLENRTVVREVKSIIEGSVAQLVTLKAMGTKHMKREYVYRSNLAQKEQDLKHLQQELDRQTIDSRSKGNIIDKQRQEIRLLKEELRKYQNDISAKVEFIDELQNKVQNLMMSEVKEINIKPNYREIFSVGERCLEEQHLLHLEKQKDDLRRLQERIIQLETKFRESDSAGEASDQAQSTRSHPGSAGSIDSLSESDNLCLCKRKDYNKILKLSEESYLNLLTSLIVCLGISDLKYNKSLLHLNWSQCKDVVSERKANQKKILKFIQILKNEERKFSPRPIHSNRIRCSDESESRKVIPKPLTPPNGQSSYISDMIRHAEDNLDKERLVVKGDAKKFTPWRPVTSIADRRIPLELKNGEILALLGSSDTKSVPKSSMNSK